MSLLKRWGRRGGGHRLPLPILTPEQWEEISKVKPKDILEHLEKTTWEEAIKRKDPRHSYIDHRLQALPRQFTIPNLQMTQMAQQQFIGGFSTGSAIGAGNHQWLQGANQ